MRPWVKRTIGAVSTLCLVGAASTLGSSSGEATAATTAAAVTTNVAIPKGNVVSNGKTWVPVVKEDFTKAAARGQFTKVYGSAWAGYSGFRDTTNRGVYAPDKVLSVSNGNLNFFLHTANGVPQVAAPMPNGYKPQTYGRYAIRFRADSLKGYKMAFLLWPTSDNWNDGEIDWPDGDIGGTVYPASAIVGTYTGSGAPTFEKPAHLTAPKMGTGWHDAVIEWTKGHVRWYWDGKLVGETVKTSGVPTKPMRWTLQAETNTSGAAVPAATKGKIQVAWAVQYK